LPRFYIRRALRLLPLLACILIVAIIVNRAFHPGYPDRPTQPAIVASAFYYANWFSVNRSPGLGFLGPTWSLSIEEQFYLFWPMLLIGLLALKPSRRTAALTISGATIVAILYRNWFWYRARPQPTFVDYYLKLTGRPPLTDRTEPGITRVYFGSDTRAHQLLLGCALAAVLLWLAPKITRRGIQVMKVVGVLAAIVMASFLLDYPHTSRAWLDQWGAIIFEFAVALFIASVVIAPRARLARLMSLRPMTWTGERAYGMYLIHPIVYAYLGALGLGVWGSTFLHLFVVFLAAWFAFRFIESPALRLKDRFSSGSGRTSAGAWAS
jgi:peptidoglycan/LPS O-acetylase OafA/YrhL